MAIGTRAGRLLIKNAQIQTGCECCTPPFCCDTGTLPSLLELTVTNFQSSRGTFTDFDPNRTYLLQFPEPIYSSQNGTQTGTRAPQCVCYFAQEVSSDAGIISAATNATSPGKGCHSPSDSSTFPPGFVTLWRAGVGDNINNNDPCSTGNTKNNNLLTVSIILQSRTDAHPSELTAIHMSLDAFSVNAMSTGLTRQQFIAAVCDRSLDVSDSVSRGNLQNLGAGGFLANCQNTLGTVSFDWNLKVSNLP
jgi:hypothetical protein